MAVRGARIGLVVLAALAVVVAVLALTLSGDEEASVGPEAVAEAAELTTSTEGMRFSLRGEMHVPNVGPVSFTGRGASDLPGQRGVVHMDMSELAERARDPGAPSPDDWKMDMAFDRRFFYMRFPLLESELDGKSWLRFDLQRVAAAAGIDPALVRAEQQQGGDPTSTLRYLRAVSDQVEEVGTDRVRGVKSTHYRATVELRKYPELVPAAEREQARRSIERVIELSGDDEMATEIWVGEDKMIRRVAWTQSMKVQVTGQVVDASFTADYYDFGTRVSVEPPPEDEVKDVTEAVARQLARGG
jgi:hypothetical protein